MKLIEEVNDSLFDKKVQVELSYAELVLIKSIIASKNTSVNKLDLEKQGFFKLASELVGDCGKYDLGYNLYVSTSEIMEKLKIFRDE